MEFGKVKAVLFDLDGTLLDTLKDIGAGANEALRRYGCPEHPISDYRVYVGHGIRELFRQAVPKGVDEETFEQALSCYLAYYPEHCTDHTDYFPGIPELMARLNNAGYLLGVLSNKTETTSRKIIAHYFPDIPFRFVWGNNHERPLKPAPEAGALACQELGLRPEEILYFGDGDTDMQFANAVGFLPVACTWGYRDRDQLQKAGARRFIDHPEELLALLGC